MVRRHVVRPIMVQHGVVRWLVLQLSHWEAVPVAAVECCGALLMNIALSKAGRQECQQVKTAACIRPAYYCSDYDLLVKR